MTPEMLISLLWPSLEAKSFFADLVGGAFGDGQFRDLILDTADNTARRYSWTTRPSYCNDTLQSLFTSCAQDYERARTFALEAENGLELYMKEMSE